MARSLCCALTLLSTAAVAWTTPHHSLVVSLSPQSHRLEVQDVLTPPAGNEVGFVLHAGLEPRVVTPGWRLERIEGETSAAFAGINATTSTVPSAAPLDRFVLRRDDDAPKTVEIHYAGIVHHPLAMAGEEYQRSFSETAGIIGPQGVFLSGTSFWLPTFGDALVTFELVVEGLPAGWHSVSQGRRGERGAAETWSCSQPVDEVYLVAGPWTVTREQFKHVELLAFLREPDPQLARRYLDATRRYLAMYESILPPFPWPSFALVENFWETGYGMPGFTLLGPKVIRFPWILTSSYPHELLHNWWGNSVYVSAVGGNWCEGLTAYMADHLLAEQRGEGAAYRRDTLRKYSDFVKASRDFPLAEFRTRFSAASEAVGYGKSLMLFHMLRQEVGDARFVAALARFWREHAFGRATFDDLAAAFSAELGTDYRPFFATWVQRVGAPQLAIGAASVREQAAGGYLVELRIEQTQSEEPFPLVVPVYLTTAAGVTVETLIRMTQRHASAIIPVNSRPVRLDVDPGFDVMRRLDPMEIAPALSMLLGDDAATFVLAGAASQAEQSAWRELAAAWQQGKPAPRLVHDEDLESVPAGNTWVLGWSNRFASAVTSARSTKDLTLSADGVTLAGERLGRPDLSLVAVARHPRQHDAAVALVAADPLAAVGALGRKLPHYGKYGYLAFRGEAADNVAKGSWAPSGSPLVRLLADELDVELSLPRRRPLAALPPIFDGGRMMRTVTWLADPEREGRGLGSAGLDAATAWVEARLREAGLAAVGREGFRQTFSWRGGEPEREMALTNLIGRVPGRDASLPPVLVMAHLDHLGHGWPDARAGHRGQIHPGADDNASGVAVLLELARHLAVAPPAARTVLFAVVSGEEAGRIGSRKLLDELAAHQLPMACLNLDTVGRLGEGTLLVLNADSAREWPFVFMGVGATTGVAVTTVAQRLDASDQVSCLERGVPAVQLFAGPNPDYHRPSDVAERIDVAGLIKVATVASETVSYLAGRKDPLTSTIVREETSTGVAGAAPPEGRRVSLGTMPDFSFAGPGVKVAQVTPGSPAARAGIREGDVLRALGERRLGGLADLSAALKAAGAGTTVMVEVQREGQTLHLQATLEER